MKRALLLFALATSACERTAKEEAATPNPGTEATLPVPGPASRPAGVVPMPTDPAQRDRMILAGYTPHADHLHAPGVNECPMTKGTDAVM